MDFSRDLVAKYRRLLIEADSRIERLEKDTGGVRACELGCCYCCSHLIELYEYEWLSIVSYLNAERRSDILDSAGEWVLKIGSALPQLLDSCDDGAITRDQAQLDSLRLQYRSLSIPCIFLRNNECQIYAVRPTACMNYFSYGERGQCSDASVTPNSCKSYGEVEDWLSEEMSHFFIEMNKKIPIYFNPYELHTLPSCLTNYLSQS